MTSTHFPEMRYEPHLEHYQLLVKGFCTDFAITEKKDVLLVYHHENDIIHMVDGRDLEAYVQTPQIAD